MKVAPNVWAVPMAALLFTACQTVQTTRGGAVGVDRPQQRYVLGPSEAQEHAIAARQYAQAKALAARSGGLNRDAQQAERVWAITQRLIPHTAVFRDDAPDWQWEVVVLTSPRVNAWGMPGGKIAVYTGMIEKLQLTDDELAALIGHEIGHLLRDHAREVWGPPALGLVSHSQQEQEADRIGVELAALAGYDPRAALTLWAKTAREHQDSGAPIAWTHPEPKRRVDDLKQYVQRVMPLYEQAARILGP
jgi:predicted Zn-dependent protease